MGRVSVAAKYAEHATGEVRVAAQAHADAMHRIANATEDAVLILSLVALAAVSYMAARMWRDA